MFVLDRFVFADISYLRSNLGKQVAGAKEFSYNPQGRPGG